MPLLLFAPGAGAPSSSAWMEGWAQRLSRLGRVVRFDYAYMREGRARPDRLAVLLAAHAEALRSARSDPAEQVVLVGKSMGARIGCHLALIAEVAGLVCLGYPLRGANGELRDQVLLALRRPVLFVQGSRDSLCPIDQLQEVRARMSAPSTLHLVEGGDHSLRVGVRALRERGSTQAEVDERVLAAVADFVAGLPTRPTAAAG